MTEELKDKAIKIKGKDYVLVSDRVIFFNENFPKGSIATFLISNPDGERVVVRAVVTPDCDVPSRSFTAYSQATWTGPINSQSALENAETSAVGRALGMMGIGVIESIATADEMKKAGVRPEQPPMQRPTPPTRVGITPKQLARIKALIGEKGKTPAETETVLSFFSVTRLEDLSVQQASSIIAKLMQEPSPDYIDLDKVDAEIEAGKIGR